MFIFLLYKYIVFLPVPVAAQAQISFPMRARGMVLACTGVGTEYPMLVTACNHDAHNYRANK